MIGTPSFPQAPVSLPVLLFARSIAILTTGSAADIATIAIPDFITRFTTSGGATTAWVTKAYAETAAGTLASATFQVRDASAGGGNNIVAVAGLTAPAAVDTFTTVAGAAIVSTARIIYIRQLTDSLNAGTLTFSIWIVPL